MVVRVAEQAAKAVRRVWLWQPTMKKKLRKACRAHHIEVVLTADSHESGTTRLAEAAQILALPAETIVVNVQGDEPLI